MPTFQNFSGAKVSKFYIYSIIGLTGVPAVVYIAAISSVALTRCDSTE